MVLCDSGYTYFPLSSFCLGTEEPKVVLEITRHVFNMKRIFSVPILKFLLKKKRRMKSWQLERLTSKSF